MTDIHGFARLGENPKLKFVPGRKENEARAIAELRLCLLNFRKRGDDFDDRGLWVDASLWDEQAELVARTLKKGDKVYIVGDLSASHWTDKETGEARSKPELHINIVTLDLRSLESFRMKPRSQKSEAQDPDSQVDTGKPNPELDNDIPFGGRTGAADVDKTAVA
ncbi:MAG: single-stranded DNA-binding protein [Pseudomonadota bacterium]